MKTEWIRESQPVNPADFAEDNGTGLRRMLLPGQRLVQDAHDGQWYIEHAALKRGANDCPLFRHLKRAAFR